MSFKAQDMRIFILLAVVMAANARPDGEYYDTQLENIDTKEIISNLRLLKSYALCFLGKGKCTPNGSDVKKLIPDAVQSKCKKCTEQQKSMVAEFIKAIIEKLPNEWEDLSKEYNPKGTYTEYLNEFIKQYAPN